jgi:aldehyde dehydrogenase (NAD+)
MLHINLLGLAAGILTKNIDTALTFAQAVQAGSVW